MTLEDPPETYTVIEFRRKSTLFDEPFETVTLVLNGM